MSGASRFRSALDRLKELLLQPWERASVAECLDPQCDNEPLQGPPPESPQASHSLQIVTFAGAMILVQLKGRRVLIDAGPRRRTWWRWHRGADKRLSLANIESIDAIVVTHRRGSDLDPRLRQRLSRRTPVLVPAGLGESYCRIGFNQVVELAEGEQFAKGDLELTALPGASARGNSSLGRTGATTWRGVVIRVGRGLEERREEGAVAGGQTLWFQVSAGEATDAATDSLTAVASRLRPDFVVALVGGEKPGWQTRHQGMRPEKALQAFWMTGARVFMPLPIAWAQESAERLEALVASIRTCWDCHPPSGNDLLILRAGAAVEIPHGS